jgi:hypothetical protein
MQTSNDTKDIHISDDWLRLMYSEAWKQYSHEDIQGQARMSIFLTVQTALIAILAIITKPFLDMPLKQICSHQVHVGKGLLGLFAVIIGVFSLVLGNIWKSVNKAGQIHLNLRWIPIAAIERIAKLNHANAGLETINLASFEDKCRTALATQTTAADFSPYSDCDGLEDLKIRRDLTPLPKIRGWSAINRTIFVIQVLFGAITLAGFFLLIVVLYLGFSR